MPAGWVAAAGALYGAVEQHNASNKAANASKNATNASIGEQQRQFNINQANQKPFLDAGQNAVAQQQNLLGGDFSSFHNSPDYKFALQQGLQGLDRSAAAHGSLYSGGHSADVLKYAEGLANQNYNNYYSKLAQMAGQGQGSAQSLGAAGQNYANNYGNLMMGNARNQTNSIYNNANATTNLLNQGSQQFGQWWGNRGTPSGQAMPSGTFNAASGGGSYAGPEAVSAPTQSTSFWPGMSGTSGSFS